jgi:hypothetical protein
MEMYSKSGVMSLCRLFFRAWPKIFAVSPSLLKNDHELDGPSPIQEATVNKDSLDLPGEILCEILARLEIPDLVRAGCVCSSWHTAYTSLCSSGWYKRQQTPCLLYTSESAGDDVAFLYSLAEKRIYKLTLPEPLIRSRYLIGSSNGWLVTADERAELHILNPITGEQIALPSVTTIEHVKPIFDDSGAVQQCEIQQYYGEELLDYGPDVVVLDKLRDKLYVKAFVFSDSSKGIYVVVLIHNPICQLSFAWAGDSKWTWLPPGADYEDCIYMDGFLYAVTSTGAVDGFDLTGCAVVKKVILDEMRKCVSDRVYIVQAPSGDLLQVLRDQRAVNGNDQERDRSQVTMETRNIMLCKVDMAAKELVEISSLDGYALFLGFNQSLCLSVEEYPQLKANHVYLTDDDSDAAFWNSSCRDICVINLEKNSKKEIVAPQPWCNWPAPIWITLNLTKLSSALKK